MQALVIVRTGEMRKKSSRYLIIGYISQILLTASVRKFAKPFFSWQNSMDSKRHHRYRDTAIIARKPCSSHSSENLQVVSGGSFIGRITENGQTMLEVVQAVA